MTKRHKAEPKAAEADQTKARIATQRAPTEAEAKAATAAREAQAERPERVKVVTETTPNPLGGMTVTTRPPHNDLAGWHAQLSETFGSRSSDFGEIAMQQVCEVLRPSAREPASDRAMNYGLAVMGAVQPRDELEALVGVQVIATHGLAMDLMAKAALASNPALQQGYVTMATKLSRTMGAHLETLAKVRNGGKQTVEVRYIYVNGTAIVGDGTQAVIGAGGGERLAIGGQSHAPLPLPGYPAALGLPMRGPHESGDALPRSGGEGAEALPDARRDESGRA